MLPSLRTVDDDLDDALNLIHDLDFEAALPILARVVAFAPDNALGYQLRTFCHAQLGRLERAVEIADEGLARGVVPAAALHLQKTDALLALERFDEAAAAADAALALDPESGDALRTRAEVEIARGNHDRALDLLQQAVQHDPDDAEIYDALLALAGELERHPLVIETARAYLRRFEKDADVLTMLGHAYVETGDLRRADRAFREAADLAPDQVSRHVDVLMICLWTENPAAYEAYLNRLAEKDPEMADLALHEVELVLTRAEENPEGSDPE